MWGVTAFFFLFVGAVVWILEHRTNDEFRGSPREHIVTVLWRTHSQISQVVRELRKTAYRVPMVVLAWRKHYCTTKNIIGKENIYDECKLLLKDQATGCPEFKNAHKVKGHSSLQKGGCNVVHDIEDLVKVGQLVKVLCCLHFQVAVIMVLVLCQMMLNWYFVHITTSIIQSFGHQWPY
ncbi:hypothetical protein AAZX31_14G000200 [Glycine max]